MKASLPKIVALAALAVIGVFGLLSTLFAAPESAPQQAVVYARGCFWVVLPYCVARIVIYLLVFADEDSKAAKRASLGRLWGGGSDGEGDGE